MGWIFNRKKDRLPPIDVTGLAKQVGQDIDNLATQIFARHRETLMDRPITHVVPGVWGASEQGQLSAEQIAIHDMVAPAVARLAETLMLHRLPEPQRFAVLFCLRSLIISKITYMIEAGRNLGLHRLESEEGDAGRLSRMEPMGNA